MSKKLIEVQSMDSQTLLLAIKENRICIPNFQRDYVWNKTKIIDFLNSLINSEPFGSILTWTPSKSIKELETKSEIIKSISLREKNSNKEYLIDGQQRTTSLLILLNSIDLEKKFKDVKKKPSGFNFGSAINFDYVKKEFTLTKIKESKNIVSSSIFFHRDNKIQNIKEKLKKADPHLIDQEIDKHLNTIINIQDQFNNFKISVIKLINHNLDEVIEIFSKINTKGSKLTNFNLIHAKWSILENNDGKTKFNFEKNLLNLFSDFDHGYEKIDKEIFLDSLYLHISEKGPIYTSEGKLSHPIKSENSDQLIEKFNINLKAFKKAYEFLKGWDMNYKFLPSKIIFKWLTYFFVKVNNKPLGKKGDIIKKYIKLSCINDRYRSNTLSMLEDDIKFIDEILLSNNVIEEWEKWKEEKIKFYFVEQELKSLENVFYNTSSMISNFIKFHLFTSTKSFFDGEKHSINKKVDMHHIFPKNCDFIKENDEFKIKVNSIVNTTPLAAKENNYISNNNPSKYLEKIKHEGTIFHDEILKEHGICKEYLETDDFNNFFKRREKFLLNEINKKYIKV